jgi:hypothetical protein
MTDDEAPRTAPSRLAEVPSVAGLALVTLAVCAAFCVTLRPPLQDLPQHLAAARVLLDPAHPGFDFQQYFEVDWLRSQYLGTYVLLGVFYHPLALVLDEPLLWATRALLLSLALGWAVSSELLYRALTRRRGLGAFALVLFFNAHLILGFINFLLGIVACFTALACLAAARARARRGARALPALIGWGAAAFGCFYLHVVPFALLLAAVGGVVVCDGLWPRLVSRWRPSSPRQRVALGGTLAALAPALLAAAAWLFTPAGVSTREAAAGAGSRGQAVYLDLADNWAELERWLMDAFASPWDTRLARGALAVLVLYVLVETCSALWGAWRARRGPARSSEPPLGVEAPLLWTLRAFVPISFVLYFTLPSAYDWIWPINARFPLLGFLCAPLWLPVRRQPASTGLGAVRAALVAAALLLAGGEAFVARQAFAGFSREMDGFDDLLAAIPPGQRSATLVFDRFSRHVEFAPFLHVGAYYQAQRGGVSFFSFADFPQSPVRFKTEQRPPRVPPRWEWMPERVRDRELTWFDYVITRGGPGRLARSSRFEELGRYGRFRLFRKRPPDTR